MEVLALALISVGGIFADARAAGKVDEDYAIAARYAPIIFQQTGQNPRADAITNFDFDGDWSGTNNWKNLGRFPLPAYVYYAVAETESHIFLTYAFFHPRDYTPFCFFRFCHENDLEGAGLTVDKVSGEVVYLETKAHSTMDRFPTPTTIDVGGERKVAVLIEREGHAVRGWTPGREGKFLVYSYSGHADDPAGASEGKLGYELLPIETTLWAHRGSVGRNETFEETYDYKLSRFALGLLPTKFAGGVWARNAANPPWGWGDGGFGDLAYGDWFFDPALAVSRRVQLSRPVSLEYVHNPYVGIFRAR